MTERKLTRAEIPMCPECGEEIRSLCADGRSGRCTNEACARYRKHTSSPDYGHYEPDVAGVVAVKIRERVTSCEVVPEDCAFDNARVVTNKEVLSWADELENKP